MSPGPSSPGAKCYPPALLDVVEAFAHVEQFVEVGCLQDTVHVAGRVIDVDLDALLLHRCQDSEYPTGDDADFCQIDDQHLANVRADQREKLVSAFIDDTRFRQVLSLKADNCQWTGFYKRGKIPNLPFCPTCQVRTGE